MEQGPGRYRRLESLAMGSEQAPGSCQRLESSAMGMEPGPGRRRLLGASAMELASMARTTRGGPTHRRQERKAVRMS